MRRVLALLIAGLAAASPALGAPKTAILQLPGSTLGARLPAVQPPDACQAAPSAVQAARSAVQALETPAQDVGPERQATQAAAAFDGALLAQNAAIPSQPAVAGGPRGSPSFALIPIAANLLRQHHIDRPGQDRLIRRAMRGALEAAGVKTAEQARPWFKAVRAALDPRVTGHGFYWSKRLVGEPRVSRVIPGSPADLAGIRRGDVIKAAAGRPLEHEPVSRIQTALARDKTLRLTMAGGTDEGARPAELTLAPGVYAEPNSARSFSEIADIFDRAAKAFSPTASAALLDAALERMGGSLDRYTRYFNAQASEDFSKRFRTQSYGGFGFMYEDRGGIVKVIGVRPGSPAALAGISAGDTLLSVDGEPLSGMTAGQVSQAFRQNVDAAAAFVVANPDGKRREVVMRARSIEVPLAAGGMLPDKVGYVHLIGFSQASVAQAYDVIVDLRARGARAVMVDLRFNPGGEMAAAADLAALFLPRDREIARTASASGVGKSRGVTTQDGEFVDMRLAVLLNRDSASASELFAASMRDHGRAQVVGEPSFGKGVGQSRHRLIGGRELKITSFRWYTPAGRNLKEGDGIRPDVPIETTETEREPIFRELTGNLYAGTIPGMEDRAVETAWDVLRPTGR